MLKNKLPWSDYADRLDFDDEGEAPDDGEDTPPEKLPHHRWRRIWWWSWRISLALYLASILLVFCLRWIPPPTSAFMLFQRPDHTALHYQWVAWSHISAHMPLAVVAAEDQKFPHHWGFDLEAISAALEANKRRKRPRGASTISQQVVKNLFLWSGRSYFRKGLEAYGTLLIEWLWPKRRILEIYLNIAEFGPGIYGVEAASRAFFQKSAVRLDPKEAALLAAVLPNPRRLKAGAPSPYVQTRIYEIQRQMRGLGGPGYLSNL
jgi:monofunctional biosynthetic peptidoglycan transglycosylase